MARLTQLPDEVRQALAALMATNASTKHDGMGDSPCSAYHIAVLSDGLSNANYLITTSEGDYVLRVNTDAASAICNRQTEVCTWRLAQAANLAPILYWVSDDYRYYLSEYISQKSARLSDNAVLGQEAPSATLQTISVTELLSLMNKLSQLPIPDNDMSVGRQWQIYFNQLADDATQFASRIQSETRSSVETPPDWLALTEPSAEQEPSAEHEALAENEPSAENKPSAVIASLSSTLVTRWLGLFTTLSANVPVFEAWIKQLDACLIRHQFCHRDLTPQNILRQATVSRTAKGDGAIGPGLLCIDFEYACASHPLFELAGVLASHSLSEACKTQLIEGYVNGHPNLTPDAPSAIDAAMKLYWCFGCCWSLLMASQLLQHPHAIEQRDNGISIENYLAWFDDYWQLLTI